MLSLNDEPDFINEQGVKWWRLPTSTHYAQRPDAHGTKLHLSCFLVEIPEDGKAYIALNLDTKKVEIEAHSFEALGVKIDLMKYQARCANAGEKENKK